jgi:hypothetical protein
LARRRPLAARGQGSVLDGHMLDLAVHLRHFHTIRRRLR